MSQKINDLLSEYAYSMVRSEIFRCIGTTGDISTAVPPSEPEIAKSTYPDGLKIEPINHPLLAHERNERQFLATILEEKGHPVHSYRLKSRAKWASAEVLPQSTSVNAAWFIEGAYIVVQVVSDYVEVYTETLRRITGEPVTVEKMPYYHVAGLETTEMAKAWIEQQRDEAGNFTLSKSARIEVNFDPVAEYTTIRPITTKH